ELLVPHADGGGAAAVGVEQAQVEAGLGVRRPRARPDGAERERVGGHAAGGRPRAAAHEAAEEALEEVGEALELLGRDVRVERAALAGERRAGEAGDAAGAPVG